MMGDHVLLKRACSSQSLKIRSAFIMQIWMKNGVLFCIFKSGVMTTAECSKWVIESKEPKTTALDGFAAAPARRPVRNGSCCACRAQRRRGDGMRAARCSAGRSVRGAQGAVARRWNAAAWSADPKVGPAAGWLDSGAARRGQAAAGWVTTFSHFAVKNLHCMS